MGRGLSYYHTQVGFTKHGPNSNHPLFHFKEIDYIMITGDFPSHEVWKQSREWNLAHSKMMSDLVSDVFPDKLILPSVGNHESFPCNRFGN